MPPPTDSSLLRGARLLLVDDNPINREVAESLLQSAGVTVAVACNGQEVASGSIRIHDRGEQERILRMLKISEVDASERFGHMLEAFEYGAPPHGGIAPGIDRTVALLAQESDIREMIAFPKTKSASDPMTGAPSPASQEALDVLKLKVELSEPTG